MNIEIETNVLENIKNEIRSNLPNESGGLLLGCCSEKGIKVNTMILSGPGTLRSPSFIEFDEEYINTEFNKVIRDEQCKLIGLWHSHIDASSVASKEDNNMISELVDIFGHELYSFVINVCSNGSLQVEVSCMNIGKKVGIINQNIAM